ncbi:MAG: DUF4124 domain-containing protein [Deltaproteobacteria bacterium]|nr:DUF4124 domain-containing protein [Deltaproteobacteria bacterium]
MTGTLFRTSMILPVVILSLFISLVYSGNAWGGPYYQYTDSDGSVVITDNPPPGVKAKPLHTLKETTEQERVEWEKEKTLRMQQYREEDAKRSEKSDKIKTLREELERAKMNEEKYRSNMNQSHGFAQKNSWKKQLEEQQKEIDEIKKKIDEAEKGP